MSATARPVFFVGSIPLTRAFDVFTTIAEVLPDQVARMPDGEIGDRNMWVQCQYPVLVACPALELSKLPPEGPTRRTGYQIPLRLRADAAEADIWFSELGYARHALASYGIFRELKAAGKIPKHIRFQVNLPTPMDVMTMVDPESRVHVEEPYERALLDELDRIQATIPADQLSITWDIVQGLLLWEDPDNRYVTLWFDRPLEAVVERFVRLGAAVRPGVELGYHLCYGSQDHKFAIDPRDLGACVKLTRAIARDLPRPIDYVHMPVPRNRADDAFYAPLAELTGEEAGQVYLGLIHYTDGVDGTCQRIGAAARHMPEFGIATQCGFGRRPSHQDIQQLIRLHAEIPC